MNNNYFHFDGKIPELISKKELTHLFKLFNEGSMEAREKIIFHNIRLVTYEMNKKFIDFNYDKSDLFSIGILGLIKAVDSYDITKDYEFSTFATRCIDNEILMFIRKLQKECATISIENVVYRNKNDDALKIEDLLTEDYDLVKENENVEVYKIVREIVEKLPPRKREMLKLYFGFYNDHTYLQREIADMFNVKQSNVSGVIKRVLRNIEKILIEKDIIEKNEERNKSRKRIVNK